MPTYTTDPSAYDDDALEAALRIIVRGSASAAADAATALRVSGASRQMRYDMLVPKALKDGEFSPEEREQIIAEMGRGRLDVPQAEPSARTSVIHVRVTPEEREEIEAAAMAAGKSTSELVRERLFGA
jgi:hypothetical protein